MVTETDTLRDMAERNQVSPAMLAGEVRALLDLLAMLLADVVTAKGGQGRQTFDVLSHMRDDSSRALNEYFEQVGDEQNGENADPRPGLPNYSVGRLLVAQELTKALREALDGRPSMPPA